MISRRAPRTSKPQENLRQFVLNNSKGIDVTKAPTDSDTVLNSINLISNVDGSLSVRKPLVYRPGLTRLKFVPEFVTYLFDNKHIAVYSVSRGFEIYAPDSDTPLPFVCRFYSFDGIHREVTKYSLKVFANSNFEATNTPSSTVVGNVAFRLDAGFYDASTSTEYYLFDESLYDEGYTPYRYLRIYEEPDGNTYKLCLDIVNPEVNVLSTADDGNLAFDMNLTQDNPYALRDVYGASVPSVKGVLAYTYSKIVNGTAVPAEGQEFDNYTAIPPETLPPVQINSMKDIEILQGVTRYDISGVGFTGEVSGLQYQDADGDSRRFTGFIHIKPDGNRYPSLPYRKLYSETYTVNLEIFGGTVVDVLSNKRPSSVKTTFFTQNTGTVSTDFDEPHVPLSWISYEFDFTAPKFDALTFKLNIAGDIVAYAEPSTVRSVTESVLTASHRIVSSVTPSFKGNHTLLKAFCTFSKHAVDVYASWFKSSDGHTWQPCTRYSDGSDVIYVRELDTLEPVEPSNNSDDSSKSNRTYVTYPYYKLIAESQDDGYLENRVDVYQIPEGELLSEYTYMFKMIRVEPLTSEDVRDESSPATHKIAVEFGRALYMAPVSNKISLGYWEYGSPVAGSRLYHSKKLFSYGGQSFENIVYSSAPDSFITPLSYIADVVTSSTNDITAVSPWKSYIIAATETSLSILLPQEVGWASKLLSSNIGIPSADRRCCLPGLNGVVFKADDKVYMVYPNAYAGDDTYMYITDLSKPVEHILSEYSGDGSQFAFATNDEYVLMMPEASKNITHCLRYSYDSKSWTYCTYPVVAKSVKLVSLNNITLLAHVNGSLIELQFDADPIGERYCDVLSYDSNDAVYTPIPFELDTGMKTDNLSLQKQFVESKFIFSTEDDREMFPVDVTVAIDGDPNITHLDVNSDSPFWKNNEHSKGVVGTPFRLTNEPVLGRSSSGIVRQLVLRYSGKGRSIRHILKGSSHSNFRLYETYVRYKTLNVKK